MNCLLLVMIIWIIIGHLWASFDVFYLLPQRIEKEGSKDVYRKILNKRVYILFILYLVDILIAPFAIIVSIFNLVVMVFILVVTKGGEDLI